MNCFDQRTPYSPVVTAMLVSAALAPGHAHAAPPGPLPPFQPAAGPASTAAAGAQAGLYRCAVLDRPVERAENISLVDLQRGKTLLVTATFPAGTDRCPVIVFSHGAGGAGDNRFPIVAAWAARGYIVLSPTHADTRTSRAAGGGGTAGLLRGMGRDGAGWANRARDASFTIDSMAAMEAAVPKLMGRLDTTRLAIAGHSYGAYTTQLLAGALIDMPSGEKGKSFADPRPRAFLMLSPQGRGQNGLRDGSWDKIVRPAMAVTGTLDRGATGQGPEEKLEPFKLSPAGDKYGVLLKDATHMSLTGRTAGGNGLIQRRMAATAAQEGTDQVKVRRSLESTTLAFLDAYVKDAPAAKAWLGSGALEKATADGTELRRR